MPSSLRSRLTYANVMVTIVAFIVLTGGTAMASVIITSNSQVAAHTIAGAKAANGINKNIIPASLGGSDLATGTVTTANIAAANKDGTAGTPSLRTLGPGAQQAAGGNDPRLAKGVIGGTQGVQLQGPLPTTPYTFNVLKAGSWMLVTWSATAYESVNQAPSDGEIDLVIDGSSLVDISSLYINNPGEHLAFPTHETVLGGLSPGNHTIGFINGFNSVTTDNQDTYCFTIIEVQPNH